MPLHPDPLHPPVAQPTGLPSILVVDDDRDTRDTLRALLLMEGHEVRGAADGATALRLAAERAPDVVLLDINMPLMDGYAVCRRLREMASLAATRIYAVTALSGTDHYARYRDAGFDRHVGKPIDLDSLNELLRLNRH
jgi:CheY-like chemotaxis protein